MRIEKVGNLQNVENIFPSSKTPVDYPTQRTLICIPLYLYFSVVSWQISKLQEKHWKSSTKTLFHRFGNFAWFYRLFWTFPIAQMVKISIVFSEDPLILPSGVLKNPIHLQSSFISNLVSWCLWQMLSNCEREKRFLCWSSETFPPWVPTATIVSSSYAFHFFLFVSDSRVPTAVCNLCELFIYLEWFEKLLEKRQARIKSARIK